MSDIVVSLDRIGELPYSVEIKQYDTGPLKSTVLSVLDRNLQCVAQIMMSHGNMVVRDLRVSPPTERKGD